MSRPPLYGHAAPQTDLIGPQQMVAMSQPQTQQLHVLLPPGQQFFGPPAPSHTVHPSGVNCHYFTTTTSNHPSSVASSSTVSQRGPQQATENQMPRPPRSASEPLSTQSQLGQTETPITVCRCSLHLGQALLQFQEKIEQKAAEPVLHLSWESAKDNIVFDYKGKFDREAAEVFMSVMDQAYRLKSMSKQVQSTLPAEASTTPAQSSTTPSTKSQPPDTAN